MYIDPKGGGADTVGYAVVGVLSGIIYVLDAGGYAVGSTQSGLADAVMKRLALIAATYQVKRVVVESNWGGSKDESAYAKLLMPIMARFNGPTQIDVQWNTGQKELRVLDCLEPIVNNHRLVVSERVAKQKELMYQFTHLTRERGSLAHDDEIEALWGAVSQFTSLVALDPDQKQREREEQAAIEERKDFERKFKKYGMTTEADPWNTRKKRQKRARWKKC
jgi:predicted phage terminase large subunit-like protein